VQSGSPRADSASHAAAPDSADVAEPDSSDVDDTPVTQVAQCTDTATITTVWFLPDSTRLVLTRLDGRVLRTIYTYPGRWEVAIDAAGTHAFGGEGYVDLASSAAHKLTHSEDYEVSRFVDARTIVGNVQHDRHGYPWTSTIEVRDVLRDSLVASFDGYEFNVAPDGSVLFLRSAKPPSPTDSTDHLSPAYIDIMRWTRRGAKQLRRVELSAEGGPYRVMEVVSLPNGGYTYRVYDEHEYRYYDGDGKPFYPGLGHHIDSDSGHVSKEQNSLIVSADGRLAAYTERSWNELTALVVIDLVQGRRTQTHFYGSFPRIYGDYVVFASDPSFVLGGDLSFRQIKQFAIYAYRVSTGALCEVARYPQPTLVK
jgi:hypothetical protein